ncbi:hypothetical protein M9H77_11488 [Catharanthus roseus]|uniref:Uncharacterized protein n=1 Tax=Catharanthus roseus TaxID=4058 RepID=A0ACC0BES1_CATRO|nr:hypothetical protein M9H77_11488 [Catharanthus roseus]
MVGLRTWALERHLIGKKEKAPTEKNLSIPGNSHFPFLVEGFASYFPFLVEYLASSKVLKRLTQDGTFNKIKPLVGKPFSYDLSAATDRWPLANHLVITFLGHCLRSKTYYGVVVSTTVLGDELIIADTKVASAYASVLGSFNIEMKILNIQHVVRRRVLLQDRDSSWKGHIDVLDLKRLMFTARFAFGLSSRVVAATITLAYLRDSGFCSDRCHHTRLANPILASRSSVAIRE